MRSSATTVFLLITTVFDFHLCGWNHRTSDHGMPSAHQHVPATVRSLRSDPPDNSQASGWLRYGEPAIHRFWIQIQFTHQAQTSNRIFSGEQQIIVVLPDRFEIEYRRPVQSLTVTFHTGLLNTPRPCSGLISAPECQHPDDHSVLRVLLPESPPHRHRKFCRQYKISTAGEGLNNQIRRLALQMNYVFLHCSHTPSWNRFKR